LPLRLPSFFRKVPINYDLRPLDVADNVDTIITLITGK
jgi:hypothetical protein